MTPLDLVLAYLFLGALTLFKLEYSGGGPLRETPPLLIILIFAFWPVVLLSLLWLTFKDICNWLLTSKE